jgi:hypothetical protein
LDGRQDHIGVSFALLSLIKFSITTCVLAHWLACLWGFVGVTHGGTFTTFDNAAADGVTWRQRSNVNNGVLKPSPVELYGVCLFVALNNIFGGSCDISPANYLEFYIQGVMMMSGSAVWAYIIGSACGIIATLDPARIEFRQTLDEINFFVSDQSLSDELAVKLRGYFRNTIHLVRAKRYDRLLQKMSTRLRGDAAFEMCRMKMQRVPYLVDPQLEAEFMCNLSIRYVTSVYSRLERVPCTNLFVIERGVVAKRGRLGLVGACLGMDVILSNDNLRDMGDAIALTFTQTISLTQHDIFSLLPEYPKAYVIVRRAALRMALVRALVKAADMAKRKTARSGLAGISAIFDMAMDDAAQVRQREIQSADKSNVVQIPLSFKSGSLEDRAGFILRSMKAKQREGKGKWGKMMAAHKDKKANSDSSQPHELKAGLKLKANMWNAAAKRAVNDSVLKPNGFGSGQPVVTGEVAPLNDQVRSLKQQVDENHKTVLARLTTLEQTIIEKLTKLTEMSPESSFAVRTRRRYTRRQSSESFSSQILGADQEPSAASADKEEMRNETNLTISCSSPFDA